MLRRREAARLLVLPLGLVVGVWGLLCLDCVTWIMEQQQETCPLMVPGRMKLLCLSSELEPELQGPCPTLTTLGPPAQAPPSPCSIPVQGVLPGHCDRNLW